jgi:LDH2 family malate/lactate/ureidoglycolate dehydrogenase
MIQCKTNSKPVFRAQLNAFCVEAMCRCGMTETDAQLASDVLVTTDLWGVHTHGTKSLRLYLKRVREGGLKARGVPHVVKEGPAWAVMDGDAALAMVSSCRAMETAIAKAKGAGIGFVSVRNGCHFGAAGYYAQLAVKHDMVGLAMGNADANMTVPGGRGKIVGNNPLAYAAPAGEETPLMLDMALSTVAAGKINAAAAAGKPIPDNWIAGEDGLPATDPSLYPFHAFLMPMAGHKGYGLALMVETLSALVSGARMLGDIVSWNIGRFSEPTGHGYAFVAIDVGAMVPIGDFKKRMDEMIRRIRGSALAKGADRIYLPGEIEAEKMKKALAAGMVLPEDVRESLRGLAGDVGMNVEWL